MTQKAEHSQISVRGEKMSIGLGEAPALVTRLMRMESFLDEAKSLQVDTEIPLFLDKGDLLYDMTLDPFNFELDNLDLPTDENEFPASISFDASIADINAIDSKGNLDWDMMCAKKEIGQITPLPVVFDAVETKPKEVQKRVPLAPRSTPHPNTQTSFMLPMMTATYAPAAQTLAIQKPNEAMDETDEALLSPSSAARKSCTQAGCTNRARSHQKCKKHGGARQCMHAGCLKNSQSRGLCIAHGGGSRCRYEGCHRASQSRGLCKSHGGGKFCAVDGCKKKAHLKQLCRMHGGGERCKVSKCMKWAQRKGWCMAHAKEFDH
ncbi:hypothetical protein ACHHYP_05026 [Achlya hypogyna]|uniref:WRKY19-like zinc finger domain-containing protein n=1 Tax=Achlya hypogyna TaxID=1202772 RepID=A0A1V9YZF2_ACHHY|nr:hypothetical protein ACHHYP_05026 [Achlya hypogyna]